MASVDVNINEAAVTEVKKFISFKGYGADFYIEARSRDCTVYLQVVLYDEDARRNCKYIHKGDYVRVTGTLKDKIYRKKDGSEGHSLIIERPVVFAKTAGRNSKPQLQQQAEKSIEIVSTEEQNQDKDAVTADDTSYYDSFKDYWDVENPWEYDPEELEKIHRHIEEYKNTTRLSSTADTSPQEPNAETAPQELNAETAPQDKQPEDSRYADISGRTKYPPATPEDEDELPF